MIIQADVMDWCKEYDGPKFHAMLCDPPYELAFMGKDWDKSGIAFDPATWAAIKEHLLPGAFIFVFGSSRGWHRLAVAIEDAGFVFHPSLMIWGWVNGSGFPKATRISRNGNGHKEWEGHRYGRQAMKPAVEMVICAQKPYEGKPVDSIVETGAGSLWIDGGRVRTRPRSTHKEGNFRTTNNCPTYKEGLPLGEYPVASGRWPPNFALLHSPGCQRAGTKRVKGSNIKGRNDGNEKSAFGNVYDASSPEYTDADGLETVPAWHCAESCAARRIGEQAGPSVARPVKPENIGKSGDGEAKGLFGNKSKVQSGYYDTSAQVSRFFPQFDWSAEIAERLANSDQVRYCAKASRSEREAGLAHLEAKSRKVHVPQSEGRQMAGKNETLPHRNPHPCVKPIALCRWLATLLLPPPEYAPRRMLVPFAGVASEMIAAALAGWEEVVGIEREAEYCEIAEARLAHWLRQPELEGIE